MFHGGPAERHGRRGPRGEDFRERFAREIGLTADQRARVDSIMGREMRGVREVGPTVQPRLDSIVARTRKELDAVLTPEQRKKAEEMQKRHPPPSRPPGGGPPEGLSRRTTGGATAAPSSPLTDAGLERFKLTWSARTSISSPIRSNGRPSY